MIKIKSVAPKEDYRIEVELINGSSITLNLDSKVHTARFGMLADKTFFDKVSTDGICIYWGSAVEISINEVLQMVQK